MPRLLPRLLKALAQPSPKHVPRTSDGGSCKKKSLYRTPDAVPSFSPAGRTRSILLEANPVTDKRAFARHKRLPPIVRLGPRTVENREGEDDVQREMTAQEREWWSSPYLRMLATPLRQCMISKRYLPNDFLVRFAVLRLPATQSVRALQVLMPDGLEHPKYKRRKARVAVYVSCWKDAVRTMKMPVFLPGHGAEIYFSKHLCTHISYLLRLRVLQELDVLINALKRRQSSIEFDADPTILRRLTRAEFKALRETGTVPFSDAAAILVVPPVNRNPNTKVRPRPSREPEIPSDDTPTLVHEKPLPPLSSLHDVEGLPDQQWIPNARVPLYNGVTMFPSAPHRAALYKLLAELLNVERRFRGTRARSETREFKRAKGDGKASHAFLLLSNGQTVKRADTAVLAIALWRLRMWEGDAFGAATGWEIEKEWRIEHGSVHR